MYKLAFQSQQPKVKAFRKYCLNELFPQIGRYLSRELEEHHQQAIEEKDAALAKLSDDLIESQEHARELEFNKVGL